MRFSSLSKRNIVFEKYSDISPHTTPSRIISGMRSI